VTDFQVAAILITLTAGLAYLNARVLRLPSAIGLMATALLGSVIVLALDGLGVTEVAPRVSVLLDQVNLSHALLHGSASCFLQVHYTSTSVIYASSDYQSPYSPSEVRRSRRLRLESRVTSCSVRLVSTYSSSIAFFSVR
jgi:hypothetical protein